METDRTSDGPENVEYRPSHHTPPTDLSDGNGREHSEFIITQQALKLSQQENETLKGENASLRNKVGQTEQETQNSEQKAQEKDPPKEEERSGNEEDDEEKNGSKKGRGWLWILALVGFAGLKEKKQPLSTLQDESFWQRLHRRGKNLGQRIQEKLESVKARTGSGSKSGGKSGGGRGGKKGNKFVVSKDTALEVGAPKTQAMKNIPEPEPVLKGSKIAPEPAAVEVAETAAAGRFGGLLRGGLLRTLGVMAGVYVLGRAAMGLVTGAAGAALYGSVMRKGVSGADMVSAGAAGAVAGGYEGAKELIPGSEALGLYRAGHTGAALMSLGRDLVGMVAFGAIAYAAVAFAPAWVVMAGLVALPLGIAAYNNPVLMGLGKAAFTKDGRTVLASTLGLSSASGEEVAAAKRRIALGILAPQPEKAAVAKKSMELANTDTAVGDPFAAFYVESQNAAPAKAVPPEAAQKMLKDGGPQPLKLFAAMNNDGGDPLINQVTGKVRGLSTPAPAKPVTEGKGLGQLVDLKLLQVPGTMEPGPKVTGDGPKGSLQKKLGEDLAHSLLPKPSPN